MRIVASSAVCSSCCCTGRRCASTSAAAPAVVRNAPVMIWAARLWILVMALIMALPLLWLFPGMCHAEHPYSICGTTIALYTCRRLITPVPQVEDASADSAESRCVAPASSFSRWFPHRNLVSI